MDALDTLTTPRLPPSDLPTSTDKVATSSNHVTELQSAESAGTTMSNAPASNADLVGQESAVENKMDGVETVADAAQIKDGSEETPQELVTQQNANIIKTEPSLDSTVTPIHELNTTLATPFPDLPLPTAGLSTSLPFADTSLTTQASLLDAANLGPILNPLPLPLPLETNMADLNLLSGPMSLLPLDAPVPLPAALSDLAANTPAFPDSMWHLLPPDQQTVSGSLGELSGPPLSEIEPPVPRPEGFAKLEFPDGHFYMTTYAVELGRDMKAFRLARQHAMELHIDNSAPRGRSQSIDQPPQTPMRPPRSTGPASVARSFVSESGGIIGEDDAHISFGKRRRKKSKKSKSSDSQDSQVLRKNHSNRPELNGRPIVPATVDPNVTARLEPSAHMGDPHFVPHIPIHPANLFNDGSNTGKGISRKHIKIAYNFDTAIFEMHVHGRNGAFHDNDYYGPGSVVSLHHRSVIQVAGVDINFVLPKVQDPEDQGDSGSVSRMSFAFEDGQGESIIGSDIEQPYSDEDDYPTRASEEDELSDGLGSNSDDLLISDDDSLLIDQSQDEDDDDDDEEDDEEEEEEIEETPVKPTARIRFKTKQPEPKEPVRRGRPPKGHAKPAVKIKLKLGRINAEDLSPKKEKIKVKDTKKDSPPPEPKKAASKTTAKAPLKSAVKSASKTVSKTISKPDPTPTPVSEAPEPLAQEQEPEKEKDPEAPVASIEIADGAVKVEDKDKDKEKDKDDTPKEPKAIRIARDEPLLNGEGVNIADLPAGFVLPPRKKGPGRPPKDGIMSKREKALLIKQIKQEEQARRMGIDISQLPRPEPRPKPPPRRNSKGEVIESEGPDKDGDGDKTKIIRPPRSPSPEIRIEDYSEEQLQRPQCNYVILIHEAIKNSKTGALNLQQIYSAIERRWPFFKFRTTSNGWQSSVRHNLGQHPAFKQVEKDGKGWLWGINDGVPIERERKKKATPPPQPMPNPHAQYPYGGYPVGAPRPTGPMPPGHRPPMNGPPRTFGPPATGLNGQTYSSPYTPATSATGTNGVQATQGSHQYAPGQYANRLQPTAGAPGQHQPPTRTPPMPASLSGVRFNPPSQDLIDTFRRVFIGTAQKQKDGMDLESATRIVDNAIKRVLHPEQMSSIQAEQNELSVAKAFETCLTRAQGPVRKPAAAAQPGQHSAQHSAHGPSNGTTMPPRPGTMAGSTSAPGQHMVSQTSTMGPSPNTGVHTMQRPAGSAGTAFTSTGPGARPMYTSASPGVGTGAVGQTNTGATGPTINQSAASPYTASPAGVGRPSISPANAPANGTANSTGNFGTTQNGGAINRPANGVNTAPVATMSTPTSTPLPGSTQMQRPLGAPTQGATPAQAAIPRATMPGLPLSSGSAIPPSPFAQNNRPSPSTAGLSRPGVTAAANAAVNTVAPRLPVTNPPPPMNMNMHTSTNMQPSTINKGPSPNPSTASPMPNTATAAAPVAALAALSSTSATTPTQPALVPATAPIPPPQPASQQQSISAPPRPSTPAAMSVLTKLSGLPKVNGTSSPLRPMVEPLTPPPTVAGASENTGADVAAGVKRRLEALSAGGESSGADEGGLDVKRQKIEA